MGRNWLTEEQVEQAVYGGAILGGGGGGWIGQGLENGKKALTKGRVELVTIDELKGSDKAVCVSLVGAPAAKEQYVSDAQFYDTIELMQSNYPESIQAIITNENGAATTVNGWLQAALTGLPILDAPCNGRAHPTGSMGALNLSEKPEYISYQTAAGGKWERAVRAFMSGELQTIGDAVRTMSVAAGGMVAVARNPVSIEYLYKNAAVGGISQAIELGKIYLSETIGLNKIEAVTTSLQGRIVKVGTVNAFQLNTAGGFDVGVLKVDDCD